jgi:hypothetical protein|tara:strand:+ start:493 stop:819 length:327 start_codon:yes stop_codon:yes gene_type:complete
MKTLELFKEYETLLKEADEVNVDATDISEQPPVEDADPVSMTSEGEKFLIRLLVKAFLHVPDDSEGRIAKELQGQFETMDAKDIASQIESFLEIGVEDTKSALDQISI